MEAITLHDKQFSPYITSDEIKTDVKKLAERLFSDYGHTTPLFIGVLNGSFIFMADLLREYPGPCEVSFVKVRSYSGTQSSGTVTEVIGLSDRVKDREVVLIEDIVDTGNTMVALHNIFEGHEPAGLKVATLFFKPEAYKQNIPVDYVAREIQNQFIVGYGLDYDGLGRNLPHVYKIIES